MTPDPTDNRATAERLARDIAAAINKHSAELDSDTPDYILADALTTMLDAMQRAIVARDDWYGGKPGLTHRDRTAEREAARKAWDAAVMAVAEFTHDDPRAITYQSLGQYRSALSRHMETVIKHDLARYLAAEFDAGERVTLSDGSVVELDPDGVELVRRNIARSIPRVAKREHWPLLVTGLTGADFDAVKRLAEQRGAER